MTTRPHVRRLLAAPLLLLTLTALGACSSGSGSESEGVAGDKKEFSAASDEGATSVEDTAFEPGPDVAQRAVISTGEVTLAADDVAEAREEAERVVDELLGEITDERTETDDDGTMESTRLVVRVPSESFAEAMDTLSEVAALRSATSKAEDVTTQVIDTRVRVRAQEKSLRRVEQLLARATSIRDIVAIEAQLTRRQAELDSLKSQQAYLADRTSQGTITVRITRTDDGPAAAAADADGAGFTAGLSGGWRALKTAAVVVATVAGAVLPWAVALLVVGWPLLLVARRVSAGRSGSSARTPSAG